MQNFFVILGGMGTLATESFIHLLNKKTPATRDQEYLNYIVVNHAEIPDRTAFIKDPKAADPRPLLIEDIQTFAKLDPTFFVLTCNTAHFFFDDLQKNTAIPILHMPKIAIHSLDIRYHLKKKRGIIFLGTEGSLISHVYQTLIEEAGYIFLAPAVPLQQKINSLIYDDIKEKNYLNFSLFQEIMTELLLTFPNTSILLGCTELSYLFDQFESKEHYPIIDAQSEVIDYILNHPPL